MTHRQGPHERARPPDVAPKFDHRVSQRRQLGEDDRVHLRSGRVTFVRGEVKPLDAAGGLLGLVPPVGCVMTAAAAAVHRGTVEVGHDARLGEGFGDALEERLDPEVLVRPDGVAQQLTLHVHPPVPTSFMFALCRHCTVPSFLVFRSAILGILFVTIRDVERHREHHAHLSVGDVGLLPIAPTQQRSEHVAQGVESDPPRDLGAERSTGVEGVARVGATDAGAGMTLGEGRGEEVDLRTEGFDRGGALVVRGGTVLVGVAVPRAPLGGGQQLGILIVKYEGNDVHDLVAREVEPFVRADDALRGILAAVAVAPSLVGGHARGGRPRAAEMGHATHAEVAVLLLPVTVEDRQRARHPSVVVVSHPRRSSRPVPLLPLHERVQVGPHVHGLQGFLRLPQPP
mmetsp:Transcript_47195/g.142916  ORF Transcript_47195/g.142916 Transcript_47195/m.142916 type:complete len:400 (-) Transcript_47195:219-1418(-)